MGERRRLNATRGLEALLVRALARSLDSLPWSAALRAGASLGEGVRRLGIRRRVAETNLAIAFPDRSASERRAILAEHYRELGRVAAEYPRMAALLRAPAGEAFAEARGLEHLEAARAAGRGAILLTGHFGHFELLGAWLGRMNPVDFVVKPLSNPRVEDLVARWRFAAGVGTIPLGSAVRRVFAALRANRWVAMLGDQDARGAGVFVPFFGRPTSTAVGPAAIALKTGAPIVMGFATREADGRHRLTVCPPLVGDAGRPDAVEELTARHTACLEGWVRAHPASWFWLHRRWKTPSPGPADGVRRA